MSFNTIDNISAGEIASIISNNLLEHLNLNDCSLRDHVVVAIADASILSCTLTSATTTSHNRQSQRLEMLFIVIMQ